MMAATCLYRYLEGVLGLPARADAHFASARNAYYQAFLDSLAWEGERYMPTADWSQSAGAGMPTPNPAPIGGAIVAKYLALELGRAKNERWVRAVRAAREAAPLATSVWDVHANAGERLLVYAKSPCPEYLSPTATGRFFLHVAPFAPERAAGHQGGIGSVNLDGGPFTYLRRTEEECVFSARLPDYPLSWVRTGQYTARREGAQTVYDNLWSVRFAMPLARSIWTVYASAEGRGLDYVKTPCRRADTQARFFLHVYPLRAADLPAAVPGYANLDFAWEAKGALVDGDCRVSAALPDFPIAFVRTGQYRGGIVPRRLWNARIDLAGERARRVAAP